MTSNQDASPADVSDARSDVYQRILKSSAVIGMSALINVGIGVVRTKFMAVLLGPSGYGLLGLYSSIADLTVTLVGMGVYSSGIRQVAEAAASERMDRVAKTATTLQRVSVILGLLGAVLLVVFASEVSQVTFGDTKYAGGVALVSLAVFFRVVSSGLGALLQGMRRISDLARINVFGALLGAVVSIPVVYFLGEKGAAPALVSVAALTAAASWWHTRKLPIESTPVSLPEFWRETTALVKLGSAFLASGLMTAAAAYVVRLLVTREVGLDAAGLYSSSWTLGGLYVGYILQSMGADFYPQLVAFADDHSRCNRLVNDQARVSLLLAGPGIIATMTLSPLVLSLLYSSKFIGAVEILRWICLGMAMRVVSWPMGYILIAKNRPTMFIGSDLAWAIVNILLTYLLTVHFGLAGAAMAFFGSYLFQGAITFPMANLLTGFRWSADTFRTMLIYFGSISLAFAGLHVLPNHWGEALGVVVTLFSSIYSLRSLLGMVSTHRIPASILRLLTRLRLVPAAG